MSIYWLSTLESQELNLIVARKPAYNIRLYALYNSLELGQNIFDPFPTPPKKKTNIQVGIPISSALARCYNAMFFQVLHISYIYSIVVQRSLRASR